MRVQASGLIGEGGIYPLAEYCTAEERPALIIFNENSDQELTVAACAGLIGSLLVTSCSSHILTEANVVFKVSIGYDPPPLIALVWLLHHSFMACAREFMGFQWDGKWPWGHSEPETWDCSTSI